VGDYHLHLHPHDPYPGAPDPGEYPDGLIEAYVEAAAARGVTELGFSEHLYRCVEAAPILGRFWETDPTIPASVAGATEAFVPAEQNLSLESYVAAVLGAKERGLPVLLGLEIDFFPENLDAVLDLIDPYPWDYLIGSVHWVGGWAVDSSATQGEFERRGPEQAHDDYYRTLTALAGSGAVDVLGHVDLTKKYGYRLEAEPLHWYRRVAAAASLSTTAVEINTNGLRLPASELYPSPAFLAECAAAEVDIVVGSDAHRPADAGRGYGSAIEAATAAGYEHRVRFARRTRTKVPLIGSHDPNE